MNGRIAALVLGNTGDAQVIPALRRALEDPAMLVREASAWAIARIEARRSAKRGRMPLARNEPRTRPVSSMPVRSKTKMSCIEMMSDSRPVISETVSTLRVPSERRAICTTA